MDVVNFSLLNSAALQIRPVASELRLASEWMARFGKQNEVPMDQINRLDLCLNEALANVIMHGDAAAHSQPVMLQMQVSYQANDAHASVTISDAGAEFDVSSAPVAARPRSLADAEPGGLGLLMIRSFSDAVRYQRNGNRNVLTFTVRWPMRPN